MPKQQQIKVEKLRDGAHKTLGRYDTAGRWYPYEDIFAIPGAFAVRSPSRTWSFGYLKHLYTQKFAKLLATHKPLLYLEIQAIDKNTDTGKNLIAQHVAMRMRGEA